MDEMTHDRCSDLLRDYVGGELDRDLAAQVAAHLGACDECRAEERALTALVAPQPPLDELERARLHRALTQELFTTRANADVAGEPGRPSWRRWIAPAAGSAAAVLVALLVVTGGLMGGGEDSADSGVSAVRPAAEDGLDDGGAAEAESGGGGGLTNAASEPLKAEDGAAQGSPKSGGFAYDAGGPQPEFTLADALSTEELTEIGRTSTLFKSFSRRYTVDDVPALSDRFLNQLVESSGPAARQARRCAKTLPDDQEVLPAYGATGRYEGRKALVLGFVADGGGSPRLDRYLMWVWAKGSCRQPIATLFSDVER